MRPLTILFPLRERRSEYLSDALLSAARSPALGRQKGYLETFRDLA